VRSRRDHSGARARGATAAIALAALVSACVGVDRAPSDLVPYASAAEASTPLGGEALVQRKHEMRRAHADMIHFHKTLQGLHFREDDNGLVLFSKFLEAYLAVHVDPMLAGEWQSRHPELTSLDANMRFAKAELLIQLRLTRQAQRVMDEIEERFRSRTDMLVDYPFGHQRPLGEGLELLRERKWKG
jgi:hypothetical protein